MFVFKEFGRILIFVLLIIFGLSHHWYRVAGIGVVCILGLIITRRDTRLSFTLIYRLLQIGTLNKFVIYLEAWWIYTKFLLSHRSAYLDISERLGKPNANLYVVTALLRDDKIDSKYKEYFEIVRRQNVNKLLIEQNLRRRGLENVRNSR